MRLATLASLASLLASSFLYGQAVTSSTEKTQQSDTTMKLDGSRTKITTNSSGTRATADSNGNSSVDSARKSTVTRQKHGKKIKSTTSSHTSSTVNP